MAGSLADIKKSPYPPLTEALEAAKQKAANAQELAEKRAAAAAAREEATRQMSNGALLLFIETRCRYQSRFDNSSDQSSAIWERIVHEFKKKAQDDEFPPSDYERSVTAFKAIWSKFYGEGEPQITEAHRQLRESSTQISVNPSPCKFLGDDLLLAIARSAAGDRRSVRHLRTDNRLGECALDTLLHQSVARPHLWAGLSLRYLEG